MTEATAHDPVAGPRGKLAQWAGVLGGAVAWAVQFQAGYAIVRFACGRHGLSLLHHAVTLVALAVAVACTLLAFREWRRAGEEAGGGAEGGAGGRGRFMGALGVFSSGFFALTIVAEWVPLFFWSPCWY